ncbi:TetR/AcrR family transcriptional regulator [Nonomuraea sp. NN258]|uniref:TetR/AcrR family transcriptional regulator n=1 Tax=Nonomuraea antri TaxID=2730852 RepID=UPI001567D449|nr:TetR/AcrR family transcriptional regulator [Nonomuraea antri]NRQ38022.1 TetR/AcrR family transcriptional regulator [Nonomuraea antri]
MAPRKQQEIFAATLRLVAEKGYDGLTVEGVAERSGVNKTTIYRWWPSKAALLGAALIESDVLGFDPPDTGSLRGDLVALVEHLARLLTVPPASDVAVTALGAAVRHPELDARRFFADRFAREREIFERAVRRGELKPSADPMLIVDLLAGAVWVRSVFRGLPLTDDFTTAAVSAVLHGVVRDEAG